MLFHHWLRELSVIEREGLVSFQWPSMWRVRNPFFSPSCNDSKLNDFSPEGLEEKRHHSQRRKLGIFLPFLTRQKVGNEYR